MLHIYTGIDRLLVASGAMHQDHFKPGDRVRIKPSYSHAILPHAVGRVERVYQGAPGYYDVRIEGAQRVRLLHATDLERWVAALDSVLARWRGLD
jgi:hypothetical protein